MTDQRIETLPVPGWNDRALLVGSTGSGKTTLARALLAPRPDVVVFDPKNRVYWPGYTRYTTLRQLIRATEKRLVYAPIPEEKIDSKGRPNFDMMNHFFRWVYEREKTALYIDEVYLCTSGDNMPFYYHACIAQGRELGISVFSATQRPMKIPQVIMSEAEHIYIFRLQMKQDQKKMSDIAPVSIDQLRRLSGHDFYYAQEGRAIMGPFTLNV